MPHDQAISDTEQKIIDALQANIDVLDLLDEYGVPLIRGDVSHLSPDQLDALLDDPRWERARAIDAALPELEN